MGKRFAATFTAVLALGGVAFAQAAPGALPPTPQPAPTAPTAAGTSDSARMDRLEHELQDAKAELNRIRAYEEAHPAAAGAGGGPTAAAQGEKFEKKFGKDAFITWNNGFSMVFLDEKEQDPERRVMHQFHVGGRLQADFRDFPDKDAPQNDRFFLRRPRIAVNGTFWKYYDFNLELDLGQSGFRVGEGWINLGFTKELQFRMGQFKEPYMLEHVGSDLYLNFIERSMMFNAANVDFDMGAMVHGDVGYAIYQIAIQNGTSTNTIDSNSDKDFNTRLMLTPFRPEGGVLETLVLGGSFGYGHQDNFVPAYRTSLTVGATNGSNVVAPFGGSLAANAQPSAAGEAAAIAGNANTFAGAGPNTDKFLVFPGLKAVDGRFQRGPRSRWGLEFRYEFTPVTIESEYTEMEVDSIYGPTGKSGLGTRAFYLDALFMLTGESYPWSRRVIPKQNLNPHEGGWGAWQLALRWDHMQVDGNDVQRLGGVGATHVNALVTGLNWYWNPMFKFQFNYERNFFNRPAANTGRDAEDVFAARISIEF